MWKDAKFRRSFYQIRRLLQAGVNEWQPNMSTAKRHNCTGVKFLDDSFRENDLPLFDGARPRSGTGFIGRSAIKDFDGDLCYIVLFQKVRLRSDFAALRTENELAGTHLASVGGRRCMKGRIRDGDVFRYRRGVTQLRKDITIPYFRDSIPGNSKQ